MKKSLFPAILASICLLACSKDDSNPTPPASDPYMDYTVGALRNYGFKNNNPITPEENYTQTTTNRDTLISGKSYIIFTNSNGGEEYYNTTAVANGNDYYTLTAVPGLGLGTENIIQLYLKDYVNAGNSWINGPYNFNIDVAGTNVPVALRLTNTMVSVDGTRTVNGINYTDVRHVKTSITGIVGTPPLTSPITGLFSDINSYYAPRYGMIENSTIISIDFMGVQDSVNTQTRLLSAVIP